MRVLLVSANREPYPSPVVPLGVLCVAGAVRRGHDLRVVDLFFEDDPLAAVERAAREHRPEVIGIGLRNVNTNDYGGYDEVVGGYARVVEALRRASAAPIVLGGAGFSLQPDRLLARLGADHGVVGEGEIAFPRLLDALARGERPPRLVVAEREDDPPRRAADGAWAPGALDRLPPPARDLVDPRYFTEGDHTDAVQTKRGCAFACAYCDYPDLEGRMVRLRDPEAVAEDVVGARARGASHVFFVDSVFNVPKWHALAVCRALVRRGSRLPWVCYASPVSLDEELVAAMAESGCVGAELGSDSGTDETLARLRKPFRIADVVRAHRLLAAANLRDCHTFVLGAFDETVAEAARTLDFVDVLDPDTAAFVVFHEDREALGTGEARHRQGILDEIARRAASRPGWIVPELAIHPGYPPRGAPGPRIRKSGPAWLRLARWRRASAGRAALTE